MQAAAALCGEDFDFADAVILPAAELLHGDTALQQLPALSGACDLPGDTAPSCTLRFVLPAAYPTSQPAQLSVECDMVSRCASCSAHALLCMAGVINSSIPNVAAARDTLH